MKCKKIDTTGFNNKEIKCEEHIVMVTVCPEISIDTHRGSALKHCAFNKIYLDNAQNDDSKIEQIIFFDETFLKIF